MTPEELAFWERAFFAAFELKGVTVEQAAKWADAALQCRSVAISCQESKHRLSGKYFESGK